MSAKRRPSRARRQSWPGCGATGRSVLGRRAPDLEVEDVVIRRRLRPRVVVASQRRGIDGESSSSSSTKATNMKASSTSVPFVVEPLPEPGHLGAGDDAQHGDRRGGFEGCSPGSGCRRDIVLVGAGDGFGGEDDGFHGLVVAHDEVHCAASTALVAPPICRWVTTVSRHGARGTLQGQDRAQVDERGGLLGRNSPVFREPSCRNALGEILRGSDSHPPPPPTAYSEMARNCGTNPRLSPGFLRTAKLNDDYSDVISDVKCRDKVPILIQKKSWVEHRSTCLKLSGRRFVPGARNLSP